jgi:hypothetical protein
MTVLIHQGLADGTTIFIFSKILQAVCPYITLMGYKSIPPQKILPIRPFYTKCIYLQHCSKKLTLFKNQIIKKIVAAALLVVFAFSITPTIVFHNWLANHTDTCKKSGDTNTQQIGKQTFNCHCDHIVAESPFTEPVTNFNTAPAQSFSLIKVELQVRINASQHYFYSLRGPPAV